MSPKIRVFLADDHLCVRDGIKRLINEESDMTVIAEADNGATLLEQCKKLHPDVIVLDISMPGMNGVEVARQLKPLSPKSKTLVLTIHDSTAYLRQMLKGRCRRLSSQNGNYRGAHSRDQECGKRRHIHRSDVGRETCRTFEAKRE